MEIITKVNLCMMLSMVKDSKIGVLVLIILETGKNDLLNGKGIMKCPNGDQYEGEFKDDELKGLGFIKYNDGSSY